MLTLSVAQRRQLSAQGHALNPVVIIGKAGLSHTVLDELDCGLKRHELIKIKVHVDDRTARYAMLEEICQNLEAAPIQHIGKTFLIYRPKPEDPTPFKTVKTVQKRREPRRTKRSYQD